MYVGSARNLCLCGARLTHITRTINLTPLAALHRVGRFLRRCHQQLLELSEALLREVARERIARIEPKQLVPILADLIVEANLQEEDVVGRICAQASLHDDQARPKR